MTLVRDLEATRALIAKPEHWTKGAMARNAEGRHVTLFSGKASAFCLRGAVAVVARGMSEWRAMHSILRKLAGQDLAKFNDTHTHAEVIALLDRAIAAAKMKEDGNG